MICLSVMPRLTTLLTRVRCLGLSLPPIPNNKQALKIVRSGINKISHFSTGAKRAKKTEVQDDIQKRE